MLLAGWTVALPIPLIILEAPSWGWIVFATVLLGINQGLTWSMTQTAKLDLAGARERGTPNSVSASAGTTLWAAAISSTALLSETGERSSLSISLAPSTTMSSGRGTR